MDGYAIASENCPSHQIPASNGTMLATMAASVPCVTERIGPVADKLKALLAALDRAEAAAGSDVSAYLIENGGIA